MNPALHSPSVGGPTGPATPPAPSSPAPAPPRGPSFEEHLKRAADIHWSSHAAQRLERRGIDVDQATLARLDDGLQRAAGKGSRASVIFVDHTAFVVSVANRTVITAVGAEHMREQVFTNIDSAVIA